MEKVRARFLTMFFVISVVCLAFVAWSDISLVFAQTKHSDQIQSHSIGNLQETFVDIANTVKSSVVLVKVEESFRHPPVPGKGAPKGEIPIEVSGSGIVIDEKGHILTCEHVIKEARGVYVVFLDAQEFCAKVVGKDAVTDLAVLKIEPPQGLTKANLGDSDRVRVGEWAIAIGNPYGMNRTVRVGIVSGIGPVGEGREFDFIETDASIARGDSGGPALNIKGEVIGVMSSLRNNVGLIVPINVAKEIAGKLIKDGKVTRGYLGVRMQSLTTDLAKEFGLEGKDGVLVGEVKAGSPAAESGMEPGDVIVKFDGKGVTNPRDLLRLVAKTPPHKKSRVRIVRDGQSKTLDVKVGEAEETSVLAEMIRKEYGVVAQEITPKLIKQFGLKQDEGVVISKVAIGTPASRAGVRPGDVIIELGKKRVANLEDYYLAFSETERGRNVLMLTKRGERTFYVVIKVLSPQSAKEHMLTYGCPGAP